MADDFNARLSRHWRELGMPGLCVRCCWKLVHSLTLQFRWMYYKALPGVFFRGLGNGTRIYGRPRFGTLPSNVKVGKRCMLGAGLFLSTSGMAAIEIGDDVSINTGGHLVAAHGIEIGAGTMMGEFVTIRDQNHRFDSNTPIRNQGLTGNRITIGKDVWIGRGVFIGPGVTIGEGCVVGANSVVVHDLPPFTVAVGAPARVVRQRAQTEG
jgi:acetyltransferase-like isoleucine patch superfamily enzyme